MAAVLVALVIFICFWRAEPSPRNIESTDAPETSFNCTSTVCRECHPAQFDSWHRTYHRTMTRDAATDTVKGDFNNATHRHQGLTTRMTNADGEFFMELPHPDWAAAKARAAARSEPEPALHYTTVRVDRVVGSHWIQEYLHRESNGRYIRLPILFHIGQKRWVHSLGAFLAPDSQDFWARSRGANWNESCLYCHNTEPAKHPVRGVRGEVIGYESQVTELGIACAACHGPGVEHVRARRGGEPTAARDDVVNPSRLPIPRRDQICGHCHGAFVPNAATWDRSSHRDPFIPGRDLGLHYYPFRSEAEQMQLAGLAPRTDHPAEPLPNDGRFWGDGTPLTTALEYNGMTLSACYQNGSGALSCASCHVAHGSEPDHMLKPRMRTNDACLQCHPAYRDRLAEHTRHASDSSGSLCVNCHMPHQTFSLMTTHRSHRIQIPDLKGSIGTGKPHACNLCHLDRSLGWTRTELAKWPHGAMHTTGTLSIEDETIAASLVTLSRGDARSRVVTAGAFLREDSRKASGTDWQGSMLVRLIAEERYPMVRELLGQGLVAAAGGRMEYDPLSIPTLRQEQTARMRLRFDAKPVRRSLPNLPLTAGGLPDEDVLRMLRRGRTDPDLVINE